MQLSKLNLNRIASNCQYESFRWSDGDDDHVGNNGLVSKEHSGVWGEVQTAAEQKSIRRRNQVQNLRLEGTDNIHASSQVRGACSRPGIW